MITAKQIQFRLKQQKKKLQKATKEVTSTNAAIKKLETQLKKALAAAKTKKKVAPKKKAAAKKKAAPKKKAAAKKKAAPKKKA